MPATPAGKPAWSRDADIGDYGGDEEKRDSGFEDIPLAWIWYQELTSALPSSFTRAQTGEVHAKKLAVARMFSGLARTAERARLNALPGTSDELLGTWLSVLEIPQYQGDRKRQLRRQAAAHFAMVVGPTRETIDRSIAELLGDRFVSISRNHGTALSSPPSLTYWPSINPGDPSYDLGGGTWMSERSHVVVQVQKPSEADLQNFLFDVNVRFPQLAFRILPAYSTVNWTTAISGFLLDISQLDFDGLTAS